MPDGSKPIARELVESIREMKYSGSTKKMLTKMRKRKELKAKAEEAERKLQRSRPSVQVINDNAMTYGLLVATLLAKQNRFVRG